MNNFDNLLLHPRTKAQIHSFTSKPSHALLISGAAGAGKLTVAERIAAELLNLKGTQPLHKYSYFSIIKRPHDKQDIPIESVRQLTKLLMLIVPGRSGIKRVIIIEDAQDLSEEAANAMLKMLEEPAPDCVFILTATSANNLLPTIVSRAQQIQVYPINLEDSIDFLSQAYNDKKIKSAWQLSQGCVGLMLALLKDDEGHPLKAAISIAKDYLRKDQYERLLLADSISKDKKQLALFLEALLKLLAILHHGVINTDTTSRQKKLLSGRKLVLKLQDYLDDSVSPKLITLELTLNLL